MKSTKKTVIHATPKMDLISTAIAERLNLTTRMHQRRLTRLTNAYSKKKINLVAAVGLHFFHYNFCREHEALKTTPAVAAGLANHIWTLEELLLAALDAMNEKQPEPPKRYPSSYKRKRHVLTSVSPPP